jgi:hypothetical protein
MRCGETQRGRCCCCCEALRCDARRCDVMLVGHLKGGLRTTAATKHGREKARAGRDLEREVVGGLEPAAEDATCGRVRSVGAKMRIAVATNAAARTAAAAADTQGAAGQSIKSSGAKAPAKRLKALRGEVVLVVGRRVRERGRDRSRLGAGAQREDSATCVGVGRGALWRRELARRSV